MPKIATRGKTSRRSRGSGPKTASRARVVLDFGGSSPAIEESENVESVSEVDYKVLVVHFDIPFADELYRCDVIPSEPVPYKIKTRQREGVGIEFSKPLPNKIKIVCEEI